MKRIPWTREDLDYIIPQIERELSKDEEQQRGEQLPGQEEVRPLPPMTPQECIEYICRLLDAATERPLTQRECFLHGQLLQAYRQSIMAEMLGKKGRYYVISEQNAMEIIDRCTSV